VSRDWLGELHHNPNFFVRDHWIIFGLTGSQHRRLSRGLCAIVLPLTTIL
jgi:hypothetical protein